MMNEYIRVRVLEIIMTFSFIYDHCLWRVTRNMLHRIYEQATRNREHGTVVKDQQLKVVVLYFRGDRSNQLCTLIVACRLLTD